MLDPTDPHPGLADAIRDLRQQAQFPQADRLWRYFRRRIKVMIRERNPTPAERILLLEIYDDLANRTERRSDYEGRSLAQIGYERTVDGLGFAMKEAATSDGGFDDDLFAEVLARELAVGRLRVDEHLRQEASDIVALTGA